MTDPLDLFRTPTGEVTLLLVARRLYGVDQDGVWDDAKMADLAGVTKIDYQLLERGVISDSDALGRLAYFLGVESVEGETDAKTAALYIDIKNGLATPTLRVVPELLQRRTP